MTKFLDNKQNMRLKEIRGTHATPVGLDRYSDIGVAVGMADIRHHHRGELLDMLDAMIAVAENLDVRLKLVEAVNSNLASREQEASRRAIQATDRANRLAEANDALNAEIDRLNINFQASKADLKAVLGINKELGNDREVLLNRVRELVQERRNGPNTIKFDDASNYTVEVKPEHYILDQQRPITGSVAHVPAKVMNLGELIGRYNTIAALTSKE